MAALRDTINEITERLINDLQSETLTPTEKLAFLRTLLPYSIGRLPNAQQPEEKEQTPEHLTIEVVYTDKKQLELQERNRTA